MVVGLLVAVVCVFVVVPAGFGSVRFWFVVSVVIGLLIARVCVYIVFCSLIMFEYVSCFCFCACWFIVCVCCSYGVVCAGFCLCVV